MFEIIAIAFVCWYHMTNAPYHLSHRDDIRRRFLMILDIDKTIHEIGIANAGVSCQDDNPQKYSSALPCTRVIMHMSQESLGFNVSSWRPTYPASLYAK